MSGILGLSQSRVFFHKRGDRLKVRVKTVTDDSQSDRKVFGEITRTEELTC